jgi:hypothetical protein
MQSFTQSQFQAAFAHGAVQSVELEPVGGQFAVKFVTLTGQVTLVRARGTEPRLFGSTDSACRLLHKLGVHRIVLNRLDRWQPDQAAPARRSRPDRAAALTRAAEYDRWVRNKVQTSRDDPRLAIADDEWQSIRAAKLAQRQSLQPE